jgi:fatty acid amide hydrolase 2
VPVDPLLQLSATELARRIRAGKIAPSDVVERHIDQIERVNPRLNAVVRDRFDRARVEAKQADERVRADPGERPPFLGVPCTIKESISLEGMPNSSGLTARAGTIASADAAPVARLRAAGFIPLGVTNVPELTVWTATFNPVYGQTCNAYAVDRIAGGSSGGEGAIIGSGGSPVGLGTDIGGSIRIPAFCNGVFGHKPSGGLVPGSGQYPAYAGPVLRMNTTGPLARRAEDLMPVLRIIAGPESNQNDGFDDGCEPLALGDPESVDIEALGILVVDGDGGGARPTPELRHAQQRAAYVLARCGSTVEMMELPELRHSLGISAGTLLESDGFQIGTGLGNGRPVSFPRETLRLATGRSEHSYPPVLLGLLASLARRFPGRIAQGARRGRDLKHKLNALLGDAVLLYPTALEPAPRHGAFAGSRFPYTSVFNALELPVTQVPLGLGSQGLPLGIQIVAAHGCDHVAIAVALELESALGGWVPPPA